MLKLTDDGIALLGNAICLSYAVTFVSHRETGLLDEEKRQNRIDVTELRELREAMMLAGSYDYRLQHRDGYWATARQSIADYDEWILELVRQDEELNKIRVKDIEIPNRVSEYYNLGDAKREAHQSELRIPISSLAPCALTRAFRLFVLDYFRSEFPSDLLPLLPEHSDSSTPSDTKQDLAPKSSNAEEPLSGRRYNRGFELTDERYVQEGTELVASGEVASATAAAEGLVEKYGTVAPDKWEAGSVQILTNTPDNTAKRLARKISKRLKESGK